MQKAWASWRDLFDLIGFSSGFAGGCSENPDRETNLYSKEYSDTMTP